MNADQLREIRERDKHSPPRYRADADRALLLAEVDRLTEYGRVQEMRGTMAEAYADGVERENEALRAFAEKVREASTEADASDTADKVDAALTELRGK